TESAFARVTVVGPFSEIQKQQIRQIGTDGEGLVQSGYFDNRADSEFIKLNQSKGSGACSGDSGGPTLMKDSQGRYVITGVISAVGNVFNTDRNCGYIGRAINLHFHRDWITRNYVLLKNHNTTRPAPYHRD